MGEVYLAQDTRLGRKVAVKVLPTHFASIPERLKRFEQEARAAAALNHPHIAAIHDVGAEAVGGEEIHFIVQEHLEGDPLNRVLTWGPDGEYLYYNVQVAGNNDIWKRRADLSEPPELVLGGELNQMLRDVSSNGDWLLFAQTEVVNSTTYDIWLYSLSEGGSRAPCSTARERSRRGLFARRPLDRLGF